jgi:dimethylglycine dehydrogenase
MNEYAKAVIIGGGMMGVGLLYHLALEGWTDVVLIEKGELTSGSTWHAAGQCPSFTANYNLGLIHDYGNKLYPKLENLTGQYVSWHNPGSIRFALTPEELDYFRIVEGMSKLIGFHMEIISPERIKELFPYVNTEGVLAGAWTRDDGHVDPAGCCNAMAKAAQNLGATIYKHTLVTDTRQLNDGQWEVITAKGKIRCEHVVNAAGSYVDMVAKWVGIENVPMTNMKHRYVVTEPIKEIYERDQEMQVFRDPYPSSYYRQEQQSMLIGIYETENPQEAWAGSKPRWEDSYELFDPSIEPILPWLERVMERVPLMENAGIKRVVNGAISHTPDGNPLLGPAHGLKNYWFCSGASIGIAQGAGSGKYLAQWMVHGAADINMVALDPRRYGLYADKDYLREKAFEDYAHMYKIHIPGEERPAARGKRITPLYQKLKDKGCVYTEAFGWERPKWFSLDGREEKPSYRRNNTFEVVAAECKGVQERVGIIDLSSFSKFEVSGRDAYTYLNRVVANKISSKQGGVVLTHALTQGGRIESEFTITRLADDHYYLLSAAAAELRDSDILHQVLKGENVTIKNVTDDYGILIVTGPKSREVLTQLTDTDLSNAAFPWLSAQEITVAGIKLRALRVSYVGELGWELHSPMQHLEKLYDALWEAGKAYGMVDFGVYAVNSMRMEKAYAGWSSELTNEITPIEAGIERFVNYKKGDFIGRDAVLQRKNQGIKIKMIYLEVSSTDADCRGGEPVYLKGEVVGMTTSGAFGHRTGKSLAFAYVQAHLDKSDYEVLLLGEKKKARVLTKSAYDPNNERLKS